MSEVVNPNEEIEQTLHDFLIDSLSIDTPTSVVERKYANKIHALYEARLAQQEKILNDAWSEQCNKHMDTILKLNARLDQQAREITQEIENTFTHLKADRYWQAIKAKWGVK